ncbi:MAG: VWA domain-containing protein, partial [Chloroflexota bacterium]|nr:VWA domain-containing protein [Chloroflexota bacterium]
MIPRFITFATVILLLCGVVIAAPEREPVRAQDDDYEWPEIGTIQIPGSIQVPGTIETAGTVANVRGAISIVAGGEGQSTLATDVGVDLILDNSGSMLQSLGSERRIDVAKQVLTELVQDTLPQGIPLALRVFGNEPDSCETGLAIQTGPLDRGSAVQQIAAIDSIDGVKTPLGAALDQVAADLSAIEGPKIVVLVTDGEETCGGNPQRSIRQLVNQGIDVRVNIVGFAVADDNLKEQFAEWARIGGGQYFDATGADDLGEAIAAALQPPFAVLD